MGLVCMKRYLFICVVVFIVGCSRPVTYDTPSPRSELTEGDVRDMLDISTELERRGVERVDIEGTYK
jgi:hypothetical protein